MSTNEYDEYGVGAYSWGVARAPARGRRGVTDVPWRRASGHAFPFPQTPWSARPARSKWLSPSPASDLAPSVPALLRLDAEKARADASLRAFLRLHRMPAQ